MPLHDPTAERPTSFPMAPTTEAWAAMTADDRQAAVNSLPSSVTDWELSPPEGDRHSGTKNDAKDALEVFFRRRGRGLYVGSDITVYYPARPRFCPDIFVAFDVDGHPREKWVVDAEGKGPDWVMEVHVGGDRKKDMVHHPEFYASLGITEYFVVDRATERLHGWRLTTPSAKHYKPILPQAGRYTSQVLDLELALEHGQLRFYFAEAPLALTRELLARLTDATSEMQTRLEEESRLRAEESRLRAEEAVARANAEAEVAELRAQLAKLRAEKT